MTTIGRQSYSQLYQRSDEINNELEPDHEHELSMDLDISEECTSEDNKSLPSIQPLKYIYVAFLIILLFY